MIIDSTMKAEKPREDNDQAIKQLLDWNIVYSDEEGMQVCAAGVLDEPMWE